MVGLIDQKLYGHIVSGYEGGKMAYVVPAVTIFQDIKETLAASPSSEVVEGGVLTGKGMNAFI